MVLDPLLSMFKCFFGREDMKSKLSVHLLCVLIQTIKKQIFIRENERQKQAKKEELYTSHFQMI